MRSILCRAAVFSAGAALVFFCSCERHKPDELHHGGGHAEAKPGEHSHAADDGHGHGADGHKHDAAHPAASPIGTPAQFFPSPTP